MAVVSQVKLEHLPTGGTAMVELHQRFRRVGVDFRVQRFRLSNEVEPARDSPLLDRTHPGASLLGSVLLHSAIQVKNRYYIYLNTTDILDAKTSYKTQTWLSALVPFSFLIIDVGRLQQSSFHLGYFNAAI